jgi:hypothetical protein
MYRLTPITFDERGNLKSLGINAVVRMHEIRDILVIHIKADMQQNDNIAVNRRMQEIFGPRTIVFITDQDINFLKVDGVEESFVADNELIEEKLQEVNK